MKSNECTKEERWCTCPYPAIRFEVSTLGRIRHKRTGEIVNLYYTNYSANIAKKYNRSMEKRYAMFTIWFKGKSTHMYVHRCVAMAFIQRPSDDLFTRYEVDHINGNKKDNRVENLEWVTHSENIRRYWRKKKQRNG